MTPSSTPAVLVLLLFVCTLSVQAANEPSELLSGFHHQLSGRVKSFVQSHAAGEVLEPISLLVLMKEKANLEYVRSLPREQSGHAVVQLLQEVASRTQTPLLDHLRERDGERIQVRPFWINNFFELTVEEPSVLLDLLTSFSTHIDRIVENAAYEIPMEIMFPEDENKISEEDMIRTVQSAESVEWNLDFIHVPDVWAEGITGEGIVVASADTGVQWNHPALIYHYRGYDASTDTEDHNYNWWDAVHTTGSTCGANSPYPCDDMGHGTHTTGTMVGDDLSSNQIGVAPGAKWIACRNMNANQGSPSRYIECMQFFLAPTDLNGANPNPDLRPHIINNSWGCPAVEGCDLDTLEPIFNALAAAGIYPVAAAGNTGPTCTSIADPPAFYESALTVAALGFESYNIASFSSRGPVSYLSEGESAPPVKPDISAPGSNVRSAYPVGVYRNLSGTSMATPHVSGVIALLWEAYPDRQRDLEWAYQRLIDGTFPLQSLTCSPINPIPNYTFGYGMVDAYQVYTLAASNP